MYSAPIPTAPRIRRTRFAFALLVAVPWCAGLGLAGDAHAQTAAPTKDPSVVITRTVNPRIAYRAIAKDALPVASEAKTFPQARFQKEISDVTRVGDDALGMTVAAASGVHDMLDRSLIAPGATLTQALGTQGAGGTAIPRGLGASVGGSVGGATSGIGTTVTDAVNAATPRFGGTP